MTVYLVDKNDFVLKSIRRFKLNKYLHNNIIKSTIKSKELSYLNYCAAVDEVYKTKTFRQMLQGGIKQLFKECS